MDPELDDIATAAALRAEWQAEEAEWSRAASDRWEHERSLVDVLRDCMHRGDTVALDVGEQRFTGLLTSVGTDVVRVAGPDGAVDVRIAAAVPVVARVVAHARQGGGRGDASVSTFVARLRQLERTRVRVGVCARHEPIEGELRVGRDQLSVTEGDDRRTYVPMGSVCWVRPVDDD
jgi:hypothetical protein